MSARIGAAPLSGGAAVRTLRSIAFGIAGSERGELCAQFELSRRALGVRLGLERSASTRGKFLQRHPPRLEFGLEPGLEPGLEFGLKPGAVWNAVWRPA